MHEEDYSFARAYMGPDEHILWRAKPQKGNLLSSGDYYMIPFSVLWFGFVVYWMYGVIKSDAPIFFPVFGGAFAVVGMYIVFGRFIWAAWSRKHTYYVITNKKIIRRRFSKVDVLLASNMPPVYAEYYKDGNGTILFKSPNEYFRRGTKRGFAARSTGLSFGVFCIENVSEVNRVLRAIESMEK